MTLRLLATPNPFEPYEREEVDLPAGTTIREALAYAKMDGDLPAIVSVNGEWALRAEWERPLPDGAEVRALAVVHGGKNGGMWVSVGLIVAGIVLVVTVYGAGAGYALIAGGVAGLATSLLLSTPRVPSALQFESGSPTYSLDVTNRRRIGEPIPVLYGKHRLVPDLIASPYVEYDTNDQYLYLTLCLGVGEFLINEIRIAEALTTSLVNFTSQLVTPGGSLTLFPDNVSTSSLVAGQVLMPTNDASRPGNDRLIMSFASQSVSVIGKPTYFVSCSPGDMIALTNCASAGTRAIATVGGGGSFITFASGIVSEAPEAAGIGGIPLTGVGAGFPAGDASFTAATKTIADPTKKRFIRWKPGNIITITHTASNNSTFTLATVAADGSSATVLEALTNESAANPDFAQANLGYSGPYPVNAWLTTLQYIGVDIIFGKGLSSNGSNCTVTFSVEAAPSDALGNILGAYVILGTETITANTLQPVRVSFKYANPNPVYPHWQARIKRTTSSPFLANVLDEATWGGLRAYLPSTVVYPDVTILAIRVKATDQIPADVARQINIVATRKLPIWNGTTWSAVTATRNPAWALADALRNTVYGAGLADNRIDLAKLLTLATTWASRSDYFDGVYDQTVTLWEALQRIARAGRATPIVSGGLVTFVRDEARTLRTALYSPAHMKSRSLTVEYTFLQADDPDGVDASYIDPSTWQQAHVEASVSGGAPLRPAVVDLFGVTDVSQATREATYIARVNAYARKVIHFTTEMDGHIPIVGDMISIGHDVPAWGQSGSILAVVGTTYTTTEPLVWTPSASHYVALRRPSGSLAGPFLVTQGADDHTFICATALDFAVRTDLSAGDRTAYLFGVGTTWAQDVLVTRLTPRSETEVEVTCQPYDPRVYLPGA